LKKRLLKRASKVKRERRKKAMGGVVGGKKEGQRKKNKHTDKFSEKRGTLGESLAVEMEERLSR